MDLVQDLAPATDADDEGDQHQSQEDECVERHTRNFLRAVGAQTRALRRAARRVLCATDIHAIPIDIEVICYECGLCLSKDTDVLNEHLPLAVGGFIHQGTHFDTIVYNTQYARQEQRFIIAHELGDWYLGHEPRPLRRRDQHTIANIWRRGMIDDVITEEVRADIFGLELLVPAPLFAAELLRLGPDVMALAERFDVVPFLIQAKFWINGMEPEQYDELVTVRYFKEKCGPWGQLLYKRFYGEMPLELTHKLPGMRMSDAYQAHYDKLRYGMKVKASY